MCYYLEESLSAFPLTPRTSLQLKKSYDKCRSFCDSVIRKLKSLEQCQLLLLRPSIELTLYFLFFFYIFRFPFICPLVRDALSSLTRAHQRRRGRDKSNSQVFSTTRVKRRRHSSEPKVGDAGRIPGVVHFFCIHAKRRAIPSRNEKARCADKSRLNFFLNIFSFTFTLTLSISRRRLDGWPWRKSE